MTHPFDPDAPRTEDSTGSNNDSESTHEETPAPPADADAPAPGDAPQRPVYERYDPGPRDEPPPSDIEPLPPHDARPWDSMDDVAWPSRPEPEPHRRGRRSTTAGTR